MIFDVEKSDKEEEKYDPRKRDPLYAHAGNSPIWELVRILYQELLQLKFMNETRRSRYYIIIILRYRFLLASS